MDYPGLQAAYLGLQVNYSELILNPSRLPRIISELSRITSGPRKTSGFRRINQINADYFGLQTDY